MLFAASRSDQDRIRSEALRAAGREPRADRSGSVQLLSLKEELIEPVRPALLVVAIAVSFVLMIACMNVANLLLARASGRGQEMAIRGALGASRPRLIRQLLTESVTLAVLGGILGLLLAFGGVRLAAVMGVGHIPRIEEVGLDLPALVFTLVVSITTGMLFGVFPALRLRLSWADSAHRDHLSPLVPEAGPRTLNLLSTVETGLAVVLLAGSGLLMNSFLNLSRLDWGYDTDNLLTFQTPRGGFFETSFYEALRVQMEQLPGVESAALTNTVPILSPASIVNMGAVTLKGSPSAVSSNDFPGFAVRIVSHNYFDTMRMRRIDGRTFEERDGPGRPPVAVVNRAFVRELGERDLVGESLLFPPRDGQRASVEVVGVVDDVRYAGLDSEPGPELYLEFRQTANLIPYPPPPPPPGAIAGPIPFSMPDDPNVFANSFVVRTSTEPAGVATAIRNLLYETDSRLSVASFVTIDEALERYLANPRFYALLMGAFSAIAMGIAAVGIYGVMSYSVSQRTHEIGIRAALGGTRADAMRPVLIQGTVSVGVGIAGGIAGAFVLTRYLESLLFGLSSTDPATLATVVVVVALVAGIALHFPARRAARVDPMVALRHE